MSYLESVGAVNRQCGVNDYSIKARINIYFNQGHPGELILFPKVSIRGIRIVVFETFYQSYLKDKFPKDKLSITNLTRLNNQPYLNPAIQLIFEQIKHSMMLGIASELYYESKIAEILHLLTSGADEKAFLIKASRCRLSKEDFAAINKAKSIIDEQLSDVHTISELAFLTNTSTAKLQNDFKLALGSTIHGYVLKARMKEALHKMHSSDEPIYSIAKGVGCKSPSRFAELFKKTYGITPMEYRILRNGR